MKQMRSFGAVCFAGAIFLSSCLMPLTVAAQQADSSQTAANQSNSNQSSVFDLGSTSASVQAINTSPVSVLIGGSVDSNGVVQGGTQQLVDPGQLVTPAVFAAIQQVLSTGSQSLVINTNGSAYAGSLQINQQMQNMLGGLIVPGGVTAYTIGNSVSNPLNITGSTLVQGSLFALQSQAGIGSVFNLGSLTVSQGGLLSSDLPSTLAYLNLFSSNSLTLNVLGNVTNYGSIMSSGNLNINAGGSIVNQSLSGMMANITGNIVNLYAGGGSLINSGTITALDTINIQSQLTNNLLVNNTSGLMQAMNGSINIGDILNTNKVTTELLGGDFISKQLNVFSGDGLAKIDVSQLTGLVNVNAGLLNMVSSTENLNIGNLNISGDPAIYNLSGDVTLNASINTAGAPLSIVAFGNVIANGASSISTSAASGGNILIAAGVRQVDGGADIQLLGPASPGGGYIDLAGVTTIDSHGTGGAGGSVTLVAYDGTGFNSGRIIGGSNIVSGGTGGANGNVTVIAADANASAHTAIVLGGVDTSTGTAGTGNITLAATALSQSGPIFVDKVTGAVSGGSFLSGAANPRGISINGNILTNGGQISITAGNSTGPENIQIVGNISANSTTGAGGQITINDYSSAVFNIGSAGSNGVSGSITANSGGGNGKGGTIAINAMGTGGITLNNMANLSVSPNGNGAGGSISLIAGNASVNGILTLPAGTLSAAGGAGTSNGGNITLVANRINDAGFLVLNASAGAGGSGNGGTVSITSFNSGVSLAFNTSGAGNIQILATGGSTGGDGGSLTVSSGANISVSNTATAIQLAPQAGSGKGASISFTAGTGGSGVIAVAGDLNASGLGAGAGGSISLISNSATQFSLTGSVTANSVSGNLLAGAGAIGSDGGSISIVNLNSSGINVNPSFFSLAAGSAGGKGGTLTLGSLSGQTTIAAGNINVNASGAAFDGGTVNILGTTITLSGLVNVSAQGSGNGKGGTINIQSTNAANNLGVGNSGSVFNLNASPGLAGGGNGGIISVVAGGALNINPLFLVAAPTAGNGAGAKYTLTASNGALVISGALNANGIGVGAGGWILLTMKTNAGTPFTVNTGVTANGVNGTLQAAAGLSGGNGGIVSITNLGSGGITINSVSDITAAAQVNGNGGSIVINAQGGGVPLSGPITFNNGGTYSSNGIGNGNGGSITIKGSTFNLGGANLTLQAEGAGNGNGGTVIVNVVSALTIGSLPNQIAVLTQSGLVGGNGGIVDLRSNNALTVDVASISAASHGTGAGAQITLHAGENGGSGNLSINGALSADGGGAGNGGLIDLQSSSAVTFLINASGTNSVNGTLSARSGNTSGNGGTIKVVNLGSGGINVNATSNINVSSFNSGAGGSITLNASSGILTIPVGGGASSFEAGAVGPGNYNGGSITLSGANVVASGTPPLTLNASAVGTGNGGTVSITTTSAASNIIVGNNASAGNFIINATGGSLASAAGNGGVVTLSAGANVTVDPSQLNAGPLGNNGNGAQLTFTAGTGGAGNVLVSGSISASAASQSGNGGSIIVTMNSLTSFDVSAGATTNGIKGVVSADGGGVSGKGGTITITNNGNGGIGASQPTNISVVASEGAGGSITLSSPTGPVSIPGGDLNASAGGTGNYAGGNINITGTQLTIGGGGSLNLLASGVNGGNGGQVNLTTTTSAGSITVGGGGGQVKINADSGADAGANGGAVNISSGGSLIIDASSLYAPVGASGNGPSISLSASTQDNSGTSFLQITGTIDASGTGSGNGGTVYISYKEPTSANLIVGAVGARNFISGNILADAGPGGAGTGGTITFVNASSGAPLNIQMQNTAVISANSTLGVIGQVNVSQPGQAVNVVGSAAGIGTLSGFVNATGSTIFINPQAANEVLNVGTAVASAGDAIVSAAGTNGKVVVGEARSITATGDVHITAFSVQIDGTVTSSKSAGQVLIDSPGVLSLAGEGIIQTTGGGSTSISIASATGFALNLDGAINYSLGSGAGRTLQFQADGAGGNINTVRNGNQTVSGGATLRIRTPQLNMGLNSAFTASGGSPIIIDSGAVGSQSLTITATDFGGSGGNATFTTGSGGSITVGPTAVTSDGQNLVFAKTAGSGTANINFVGADLVTTTNKAASTIVNASVTLKSDSNITINVNGDPLAVGTSAGTLSNSGTITTSKVAGSILVDSTTSGIGLGGLTLAGNAGIYSVTGGGAASIVFTTSDASTGNTLLINTSGGLTLNPGASGSSQFLARSCNSSIVFSANQVVTVSTGLNVTLSSPNIYFGDLSGLTTSASTTIITLNNGNGVICAGCDLNIYSPSGSMATISSAGAAIGISNGTNNFAINFNLSAAGASTLNLNGGNVTMTVNGATSAISTASLQTVSSNRSVVVNVNGGTFTNNGSLLSSVSGGPGNITVQSTSNLVVANIGVIQVTPSSGTGNGGTINILATNGNLSVANGTVNASALTHGNGGTIQVRGRTIAITGGGNLNLVADAASTGAGRTGGSITVRATANNGDITVSSGSGGINASARGNSTGSNQGNGGTIQLFAGRDLSITGTGTLDVTPAGTNGSGGTISLTASTAIATGNLTITPTLNASGLNTGGGGTITVTNNSSGFIDVQSMLVADAGATSGRGGTITVINTGGGSITLTNTVSAQARGNNTVGSVSILANGATPGTINITTTSISVNNVGTAGNGGTITIRGGGLSLDAGSGHSFTANGPSGGSGNGGNIDIDMSSNPASDIVLNAGLGGLVLSAHSGANGGNGGTISVKAGNNLTVSAVGVIDAGVVSGTGNGGIVNLTASAGTLSNGILLVNPTIDVSGAGGGNGGQINIINNSNAASAIQINGGANSLLANGAIGGTILVQNSGKAGGNGGISIQGNVQANGSSAGALSNTITIDATGSTNGVITLSSGQITADITAGNGTGGTITIKGSDFSIGGTAGIISANGFGNGNGGVITVTSNGAASNLTLGAGAGSFAVTANATGTGDGGSISVAAGNNLIVTSGAVLAANASTNGKGGTINLTASNASTVGVLQVDSAISANGAGNGNGGSVSLVNNSSTAEAIVVSQTISTNAGTTGSGGQISIRNFGVAGGNGGIHLNAAANLSSESNGANGTTTAITIDAQGTSGHANGIVILDNTSISVKSNGSTGSGGQILVRGNSVSLSGAAKTFDASAAGGSNGGQITLTSLSASADIDLSVGGGLTLKAQGGSLAGLTGDGGTVIINSGRSINISNPSGSILVNPLGTSANAKGGNITLSAGNLAAGNLIVGGNLVADGVGNGQGGSISATLGSIGAGLFQISGLISANGGASGNGGTIQITYNDNTNQFHMGSSPGTQSFISGAVSADGGASAATTGGNITFANNAASALDIDLQSQISANKGSGGTYGILTFDKAGQNVNIVGASKLVGQVSAHGNSIVINTSAAGATITARSIVASNGDVSLTVVCPGGTIEVGPNSSLASPLVQANSGVVNVSTDNLVLSGSGLIQATKAGGLSTILANTISMSGTSAIQSTGNGSTLTIQSCCAAANALVVQFTSGTPQISASGTASNLNFNTTANGAITINTTPGTGTLSATGSMTFGGGSGGGDVLVDVNNVSGTIIGTGKVFSIRSTSGSLTTTSITTSGASSNITLNAVGGAVTASNVSGAGNIILTAGAGALSANTVSTSSGTFTGTAGAGTLVATAISSTGLLQLTNNTSNSSITTNGTIQSSTGNVQIQSTGNSGSFVNNGNISAQTGINITTASVTFSNAATATATTGNLSLQSNNSTAAHPLTVSMAANSSMTASAGDVNFNLTTAGQINFTSTNNGDISGNNVVLNGNNQSVLVNVRSIVGTVKGVGGTGVAGSAVTIQVQRNGLTVGPLQSTTLMSISNLDSTAIGSGNVNVVGNVTATAGTLSISSGNKSTLSISSGITASGSSVNFSSPNLVLNTNSIVNASTGDMNILSNAGGAANALNVTMASGSQLNANGALANINFNSPGPGAITATGGPTNGQISATRNVNFNGGSQKVDVYVNSISGTVIGSGGSASGTAFSVDTGNSSLTTGAISANNNIVLKSDTSAIVSTGNISSSSGTVSLTTPTSSSITVNASTSVAASTGMTVVTGTLTNSGSISTVDGNFDLTAKTINNNASAIIQAINGNVNIQSSSGALSIVTAASSNINALGVSHNINLNQTTAAAISITGSGNMTASGLIQGKTGGADMLITLASISGTVTANSNVNNFTATTTSSALTVDSITATGSVLATAGNGNLIASNLSAGTTLNLNDLAGGNITANSVSASTAVSVINASSAVSTGSVTIGGTGLSSSTSTVSVTAGTNGTIQVNSTVSGDSNVQLVTGSNGLIVIAENVGSTNGSVTLTSGTAASNSVTVNASKQVTAATALFVNTPNLVNNGTLQAGSQDLTIQGTGAANALVVNLGLGSIVKSTGANVNFNTTANKGAITMTGGNGDISAGGATPLVVMNGGTADVNVDVKSINCCVNGTGNVFNLQVESGNLQVGNISTTGATTLRANGSSGDVITCGAITSTTGAMILQSTNGNVQIGHNVSSGGSLAVNTVAGGTVTIAAATTTQAAAGLTVNTGTVNVNGTLQAGSQDLTIQGTGAANALIVNLGLGSAVRSTGANVNFNTNANKGAITMTGGNGDISAGGATPLVVMNGGTADVNVDVKSINCCVNGTGNVFSLQVESGNLQAGNISTTGATTIKANGSSGDVITCGSITSSAGAMTLQSANGNVQIGHNVSSGGSLAINTVAGGTVSVAASTTTQATTGLTVNTGTVNINGTLQAGSQDLTIQGTGTSNALVVNLGAGSTVKSTGANVNFNTNANKGAITMIGGNGDISAGGATPLVVMNGGAADVNVDVKSINCCVNGTGNVFSLQVESGNLQAGNISTTGATTIKANGSSGDVITCGSITSSAGAMTLQSTNGNVQIGHNVSSGGSLAVNTVAGGTVTIAAATTTQAATGLTVNTGTINVNGTLQAGSQDLTIQGTGAANALIVNLGLGSIVRSTGANVNFNTTANKGAITMTGGNGDISAGGATPLVVMNGGTADVNVDVKSINCCVNGTGNVFNLQVESGNLQAGNISTTGATTLRANGSSGDVITCGAITSTAGAMILQSTNGNVQIGHNVSSGGSLAVNTVAGGTVTIAAATTTQAATGLTVSTGTVNVNGTLQAGSQDLTIQGTGAANALIVNLGLGSTVRSTGANVNFNTNANKGAITMTGGNGDISAGGATPLVVMNGGTADVNVDVKSINCCVNGTGNVFSLQVESGNLQAGNISTTGTTTIKANGSGGDVITCGSITSSAGAMTLQSANGNVQIGHNVSSGGSLAINTVAGGTVSVAASTTTQATTGLTVNAGTVTVNGTLQAGSQDLTIQGTGAANALVVNLGLGSAVRSTGANVNFNTTANKGKITMTGGNGDISAGGATPLVVMNGGAADVNVDVKSINCCVNGTGNVFNLQVESGNLQAGNISTTGATTIKANGAGADVITCGVISSTNGDVILNATNGNVFVNNAVSTTNGTLTLQANAAVNIASSTSSSGAIVSIVGTNLNNNGIVSATNGDLSVQSPGGPLNVVMGAGSQLNANATGKNVNFNVTTPAAINISGGPTNGLISANNSVKLYGGNGAVNVNVNQIIGCIDVNGSAINLKTEVGTLNFCCAGNIDTSNGSGNGGNVSIIATNGAVTNLPTIITSGNGVGNSSGSITITAGAGNVSFGSILSTAGGGANGATVNITATGGISGGAITADSVSGTGGSVTTQSQTIALTGGIKVSSPGGTGGTVNVTTNGPATLNIGNSSGSNYINGDIDASGVNGGRIDIATNVPSGTNNIYVENSTTLTTNGTTGTAGIIQFLPVDFGNVPLQMVNNGLITSTNNANDSGRNGLNAGEGQNVIVSGTGCLVAGEYNAFGNLDRITLDPIDSPIQGIIYNYLPCCIGRQVISGLLPPQPKEESVLPSVRIGIPEGFVEAALARTRDVMPNGLTPVDTLPHETKIAGALQGHVSNLQVQGEDSRNQNDQYIPGARTFMSVFNKEEIQRLEGLRVMIGSDTGDHYFNLQYGNCVFAPTEDVVVKSGQTRIHIPAGSIVFVMNSGKETAIYNLHDEFGSNVKVAVGNKHIPFNRPGEMLVVTNSQNQNFTDVDENHRWIAYRNMRGPGKQEGKNVFASDFSIPSALMNVIPLREMRYSSDKQDKQAMNRILKNAVILTRVGGLGSAYKSDHPVGKAYNDDGQ